MVAAYVPLQLGVDIREATRLLIAWNVGAWAFLILIARMVTDPRREASVWSRPEDENQWVLVVLGIVASLAAMAAIVWELGPVKTMAGWEKAGHLTLVGVTVLSAWAFLQVMFALHYAGVYFQRHKGGVARRSRVSRQPPAGLDGVLLSGLHHRLHVRLLRRQCLLEADATDRRHSGRRLLLLQRHHPCADHQRRREPLLAAAFAGYRAAMTETPDVSPRARATLPRGFADRDASDLAAAEAMMAKIGEVYALYGFEAVETPFVEYTDALGKFLPDQDRPNEGVFSFKDDDEQWLSLRYDLTAPLARYVAENYDRLPKPYRSYRAGWVFRNEKPGPGRFRQFMQFDADTVGSASPAADAEICMMAADCLEALGIKRGDYVIKVNNRKVLDGVMEAIGLGGEENAGRRLTVLRAIDKLDRLGVEGVRLLLGAGRKDESGDFTKGAGLDATAIEQVLALLNGDGAVRFGDGVEGQRPPDGDGLPGGSELAAAPLAMRPRKASAMKASKSSRRSRALFEARATAPIASASTPPSCAGSNITPARSSRRS